MQGCSKDMTKQVEHTITLQQKHIQRTRANGGSTNILIVVYCYSPTGLIVQGPVHYTAYIFFLSEAIFANTNCGI